MSRSKTKDNDRQQSAWLGCAVRMVNTDIMETLWKQN